MWECDYSREPLNYRLMILRLLQKIWVLPVAFLVGALVIGGGYYFGKMVVGNGRTYQAQTMYYIDFAEDGNGSEYQFLNQYTWGEVIHTDTIMEETRAYLGGAYSIDELKTMITATIESDVRYLYTRCVTKDPALSLQVSEALEQAVISFGVNQKEFQEIRVVEKATAAPDNSNIRTLNALLLGGVIGLFVALFAGICLEIVNTAIYLPTTLEKRYHIPSLGAPSMVEFEGNCNTMLDSTKPVVCMSGDQSFVLKESPKALAGVKLIENVIKSPKGIEDLKETQVVVYVKAGAQNGKQLERTLEQLARNDIEVVATMLVEENEWLVKAYYRK